MDAFSKWLLEVQRETFSRHLSLTGNIFAVQKNSGRRNIHTRTCISKLCGDGDATAHRHIWRRLRSADRRWRRILLAKISRHP
jgi:hypothetical protein